MTPPMTDTREAVAAFLKLRDENVPDPDERTDDERDASAEEILRLLRPGSSFTVDGVECVVVRKDALDWLNGEGDSFERPDNVRGNFWWRGEFRRRAMLSACEEKS